MEENKSKCRNGSISSRAEAERLLGMAEKLIMSHHLVSAKSFAQRALSLDPSLPGIHNALRLISDASQQQKHQHQHQHQQKHQKQPSSSSIPFDLNQSIHPNPNSNDSTFWSSCPFCSNLYQYPKDFENCRLRCPNCRQPFHAVSVPNIPPVVPGLDAYYCSWGFFPLGVWGPHPDPNNSDPPSKLFLPIFPANSPPSDPNHHRPQQTPALEPFLAVPISIRPPKKKKVAKKSLAARVASGRGVGGTHHDGDGDGDGDHDDDDGGGVGGSNAGDGSGIIEEGVGGLGKTESGRVDAEKDVEAEPGKIPQGNKALDPVDIPTLLKFLGVRDEEMDKPFNVNEFGAWDNK